MAGQLAVWEHHSFHIGSQARIDNQICFLILALSSKIWRHNKKADFDGMDQYRRNGTPWRLCSSTVEQLAAGNNPAAPPRLPYDSSLRIARPTGSNPRFHHNRTLKLAMLARGWRKQ